MILKALYDYYYRSLQYEPDSLPIYGWMEACISFVIVIKKDGTFVRLEDLRDEKRNGTMYVLPYGVHTNSKTPFLFWDNCIYVLGYNLLDKTENKENQKNQKHIDTVQEKHLSFVKQCEEVYECTKDDDLKSVVCFYKNNQLALLKYDILWDEIKKNPNVYLTFRIEGETKIIASNPKLINFVRIDAAEKGVCLITGEKTDIVRKIRPAPIPGCKSSASLVTFQKDRGYDSYGKEQAYNAPISEEAEFAFSTAFLKLISKDSHNKFQLGDRLYV
ncbi:MAG TPA: type I-C CRISPR-associated protein Cas8c/Csd1, partial [Candidatus Paraprevotella stercorigallinarum]|nr:type I-C CRISPR-associated protein Cas8c/Csd1 [Candidatus Paraprevotella stercorigallinarum]